MSNSNNNSAGVSFGGWRAYVRGAALVVVVALAFGVIAYCVHVLGGISNKVIDKLPASAAVTEREAHPPAKADTAQPRSKTPATPPSSAP